MALIVDLLLIFVILIISGGLFTSMYFNYKQFQDFTKFKEKSKKQDSNLQILFKKVNENDKYLKDQTDKQQKFIDQNKSQMATLSESIKPILNNDSDSKSDSDSRNNNIGINSGTSTNGGTSGVTSRGIIGSGLTSTGASSNGASSNGASSNGASSTDKSEDSKDSDEAFSPILSKVMNSEEILNNLKNIIYSY